jgi:hypothetical protein
MVNKKVRGATPNEYNGIKFKSILERRAYELLTESGLTFEYEPTKYKLLEGFYLRRVVLIEPNSVKVRPGKYKPSKDLYTQTGKIRSITLTPDFEIIKGYHKIILEVKGRENDTYPLKKKLLLSILDEEPDDFIPIYIEVHSIYQIKQAIQMINEL